MQHTEKQMHRSTFIPTVSIQIVLIRDNLLMQDGHQLLLQHTKRDSQ